MSTSHQHALITGATSGIGLGIARKLVSDGYRVSVNGLIAAVEVDEFLADLSSAGSGTGADCVTAPPLTLRSRVRFAPADLQDVQAIESMLGVAVEEFGPVSILVNNAGIQHVSPVESFAIEKWNAILAINLSSVFHTIRLTVPSMKQQEWGRIVNIASVHGMVASPFKSAYVAAKHGVLGLTKTVALEVAKCGITCNAICPGYVKTPLVEAQIPDTAKARGMTEQEVVEKVLLAAQPTGQFVTVEQIADSVAFMLSASAASMNGTALTIDGGWTAQ